MRVTLKAGGSLSFRRPSGPRVTLQPGDSEDVPKQVAEDYAHRFEFHDAPEPPAPQVEVKESTTSGPKPSDGGVPDPDDDGSGEARRRYKKPRKKK